MVNFEVRQEILDYMSSFDNTDEPITDIGGVEYSVNDMLDEIRRKTSMGKEMYETWEGLYNMPPDSPA